MSELSNKQFNFSLMLGNLLIYIYEQGYTVTYGDVYALTGHKKNSNHGLRLAADLNLFLDGIWLDKGEGMVKAHGLIHDYWDTLGGAKRISNDLNHYSVEYQGRY